MDKLAFTRGGAASIVALLATAPMFAAPVPDDPLPATNILLILADDLGMDQLHVYGRDYANVNYYTYPYPYAYTPRIDDLATTGALFRQARTAPICSPSRGMLNTGRYPFENGCGALVWSANQNQRWNESEFRELIPRSYYAEDLQHTLADAAREREGVGPDQVVYYSGLIGKVHLGTDPGEEPTPNCAGSYVDSTAWSPLCALDYPTSTLHYNEFRGILRGLTNAPSPAALGWPLHPVECDFRDEVDSWRWFYWFEDIENTPALPTCGNTTQVTIGGYDPAQYEYYTHYERERVLDFMVHSPSTHPFLAVWAAHEVHAPYEGRNSAWYWAPEMPPDPNTSPDGPGHYFRGGPPESAMSPDAVFPKNTYLRAKIEYLDSSIGYVLDGLAQQSQEKFDNLTVILVGDNGTDLSEFGDTEEAYFGHHNGEDYGYTGPTYPSIAPYNTNRMKGTLYEGGVRVPLIVWGRAVANPPIVSDQLVDMVDFYETIRELAYWDLNTNQNSYSAPMSGTNYAGNSYSFAPVLRGQNPTNHEMRTYSHSGMFFPNTSFTRPPNHTQIANWALEPNRGRYRDYYIRHDTTSGDHWYKLIRDSQERRAGGFEVTYEFYDLDFSGTRDPEWNLILNPSGQPYDDTKNALELLTGLSQSQLE